MARICVIDDQAVIRESVEAALMRADHSVEAYADARAALEAVQRTRFDLVITDLKMSGMDGMALLRALREAGSEARQ